MRRFVHIAAIAALAMAGASAMAQSEFGAKPSGTVEFVDRVGSARADQTIEVWARLTLDAGSVPINFSSFPLTGIDSADLPAEGFNYAQQAFHPFATYERANLNASYLCSGTFTGSPGNVCGPGAYAFTFNTAAANSPNPGLINLNTFTLNPGGSFEYLLGTFSPVGGAAAPGVYYFQGTGVSFDIFGWDAGGNPLLFSTNFASNGCFENACAFTRSVTAVPEPESVAMMLAGLGMVGWVARRSRQIARR